MASLQRKPRSPFWFACFTLPDGRRTKRSTKTADRKKALKIATEWEDAALNRTTEVQARRVLSDIHELVHGRPLASASIADYSSQWLSRKKGETAAPTYASYQTTMNGFVLFLGPRASEPIHFVQTADIVRWRDLEAGGRSPTTANNKLKILRTFFQSAWRDGLIAENPAARVSVLRTDESVRRPFTVAELQKLLAVADEEWRGMILAGAYTGQRLKDIALLTWANVDTAAGEIALTTSKTGRRQIIPIAPALSAALAEIAASDDPTAPLFPRAFAVASKTDTSRLSQGFHELLVAAGFAPPRPKKHRATGKGRCVARPRNELSFHSLRYTATSFLKNAGVPEAVARDIIGHESAIISRHYTQIDEATKRAAIGRLPDITHTPLSK